MPRRSVQESQLQLEDFRMTETDGSFAVNENTCSHCDHKGVQGEPLHRRELGRRITRSGKKNIKPKLVMHAIDHGPGKPGEVDRTKAEGTRRLPRRLVVEDAFPRRRSARLANRDQKPPIQPIERQYQMSRQDLQQSRKQTVHESFSAQALTEWLEYMALWMFDTLKMVMRILKYPASVFVAGLIAAMIIGHSIGFLSGLMSKAISAPLSTLPSMPSICRLPVVSVLCQLPTSFRETSSPVEFDKMMKIQAKFKEVLEAGAESAALPFDMSRGEASIRDLRQIVRYSSLRSK